MPKSFKNLNILEFGDYVWNHYEKCIQTSTNMPSIGLEMCEILRILREKKQILYGWWNQCKMFKYSPMQGVDLCSGGNVTLLISNNQYYIIDWYLATIMWRTDQLDLIFVMRSVTERSFVGNLCAILEWRICGNNVGKLVLK